MIKMKNREKKHLTKTKESSVGKTEDPNYAISSYNLNWHEYVGFKIGEFWNKIYFENL